METKIVVVGTGGVGGFIGGKLAKHYTPDSSIKVCFLSRGEALKNIRQHGLVVDAQQGSFTAYPAIATDSAAEIGPADYILLCTKAYDIERAVEQIRPMITPRTVILPFLNGVDSAERIKAVLPGQPVWDGCVYIVAYIVSPGRIAERTNGYRYMFGAQDNPDPRQDELQALFTEADIRAYHMPDIQRRVWDKFAFISTVATATSYTDEPYGVVLDTPSYRKQFESLLEEFQSVARKKGISLSEGIAQKVIDQMERIPADTTTSMQRDFRAGKNTELESLTGYIVREGERLGVPTPVYDLMYASLLKRTKHV